MRASIRRFNASVVFKPIVIISLLFLYLSRLAPLVEAQTQTTGSQLRIITNLLTGTAYTVSPADCGKLLSFSNASSIAVGLPAPGASGLAAGCWMDIQNTGTGTLTLTPN